MKHLTLILAFLMTLSLPVSAQDWSKGLKAYISGDYKSTLQEWMPLAKAGPADAQRGIGLMYEDGNGVPQDHKVAMTWYRLAAAQNHGIASFSIGTMYEFGTGVLEDYAMAHMWYNISNANGEEIAKEYMNDIARKMTKEDISKAQAMARKCMSSNYKDCSY